MLQRRPYRLSLSLVVILLLLWAQAGRAAGVPAVARTSPSQTTTPAYRSGELLVRFVDTPMRTTASALQLLERAGANRIEAHPGTRTAELWQVPQGQELALAARLNALPDIAYAEPNYLVYAHIIPNDPEYLMQWAHQIIASEGAWDLSTGSNTVIVAVVDTGVDLENTELQGRITAGKSYVPGVTSPDDDQGHGTHVAGIIAAAGNNNLGVAGMAWQVQIMPIKVLDATGVGDSGNVAHGIRYAVDNGADIVNVSLGGPGASATLLDAVQYAYDSGVLVVASGGNCGDSNFAQNGCDYENQAVYPAAYDLQVLAIAATTSFDTVTSFSNQGSYIDVAAPGLSILSTTLNNTYAYYSGTSQAAPFVSGLAALMLSVDPTLTPQEIESIIAATAQDLGTLGWDPNYGAGRIEAMAALLQTIGLETPQLLAINNADRDTAFLVDWSDVANATSYTLQRDDAADFGSPETTYTGSTSQSAVANHPVGTWYYRVRAERTGLTVSSDWSTAQSVIVGLDQAVLHAINPGGSNTYTVAWDSVPAATAYRLQESRSADFATATTYEVGNNLSHGVIDQAGGTWYYRVQAYNATIAGPWSAARAVLVVPQAPTLLPIATGVLSDAFGLSWSSVVGADGYRVQEATNLAFTDAVTRYVGANTTFAVTGQPGGQWYYRVQAYNGAGFGAASNTESVTTTAAPVVSPLLQPIVDENREGTYPITWSAVISATGYILEESATPWFEAPTVRYTGPAIQVDVTGQPLGTWSYRVRAMTPLGNSPWSAPVSIRVATYVYLPIIARGL